MMRDEPESFNSAVQSALLAHVDDASSPADAKAMLTIMYQHGIISAIELEAQIASRGLAES